MPCTFCASYCYLSRPFRCFRPLHIMVHVKIKEGCGEGASMIQVFSYIRLPSAGECFWPLPIPPLPASAALTHGGLENMGRDTLHVDLQGKTPSTCDQLCSVSSAFSHSISSRVSACPVLMSSRLCTPCHCPYHPCLHLQPVQLELQETGAVG